MDETIFDAGFKSQRWLTDFEYQRSLAAFKLYIKDPNLLPTAVREHYESIWQTAASYAHDRIGGSPDWNHVETAWFHEQRQGTQEQINKLVEAQPHLRLPDPFNGENSMVLQLYSDWLMRWSWGGLSHAVFIVPRKQIIDGSFSDVAVVVAG